MERLRAVLRGRRGALAVLAAATLLLSATAVLRFGVVQSRADVLAVLNGNVGPDFQISLSNPDGSPVVHLDPGSYQINVTDQASVHSFHLIGPGVDQATDIGGLGSFQWVVNFSDGEYVFHCDQHLTLFGRFVVGTGVPALTWPPAPTPLPPAAPAPDPAPVPAPAPAPSTSTSAGSGSTSTSAGAGSTSAGSLGTVTVSVGPGRTISFTRAGKRVSVLKAGSYTIVTRDSSKQLDVTVRPVAATASPTHLTTAAFVGTRTTTIRFTPGRWKVYSAGNGPVVGALFRVT